MTRTSVLPTCSMSDVVLINVYKFHFASALFACHSNQIPSERVQATHHELKAVDELQLSHDQFYLAQRCLIFIYGDAQVTYGKGLLINMQKLVFGAISARFYFIKK